MNRLTLSIITSVFVVTSFMNCAESNSPSRRPVTAIQVEPKKKNFKLGEEIRINLQTKLKDGTLEKIDASIDGKLVVT